jgi:poly(3-hydroxybutyrate) depolymerase
MKGCLAVAALVLASALPAAGAGNGRPSRGRLTMQVVHVVNGLDRYPVNYWQYLPPQRYRRKPPVLVFLHGFGEEAPDDDPGNLRLVLLHGPPQLVAQGDDLCFTVDGRRSCFLMLAPQALPSHDWYGPSVVATVERMIDRARTLGGDMSRVYLTGLSMGGAGTWTFAGASEWNRGGRLGGSELAAMLVVSGTTDGFSGCRIASTGVAVWALHGTADKVLDPIGDIGGVRAVNACTHPRPAQRALLTLFHGVGHDTWDRTYDPHSRFDPGSGRPDPKGVNVYQWLLMHHR